jgi:hypothetical protein
MKKINIVVLFAIITLIHTEMITDKEIDEIFTGYMDNKMSNSGQVIYFFHIRPEKQKENVNYFYGIFKSFLHSMHVQAAIYNWQYHDIVVQTHESMQLDVNFILEYFTEWFDQGGVRAASEFGKPKDL